MRFCFVFTLLFNSTISFCQKDKSVVSVGENGFYPIYNYSTKTYKAVPQNWAITQDKRGVMYFGNNQGVLEYDGVSWRRMKVNNETNIRSLAIDEKGKIFVGAFGEFGYLEPDSSGNMRYVSLTGYLNDGDKDFTDVWCTIAAKDGVYFQADNKIFRWDGKKIKTWSAEKSFHRSFKIYDRIFVREREVGLLEISGDNLSLVKGGEAFAEESVYAMIPFPGGNTESSEKNILISTKSKGLFIMKLALNEDPSSSAPSFVLEKFTTQVDPFILENFSYHILKTDAGYSVASVTKGCVIIDSHGNLVSLLNKFVGLQDEIIYSQFVDASGNLWLALSNGISRISINSPITYFSDKNGLGGTVQKVIRHEGTIYATTALGVYYLRPGSVLNGNEIFPSGFEKIASINEECWDLLSFRRGNHSSLLVAANKNIYSVDGQKRVASVFPYGPWALHLSKFDSSRVYLGLDNGFASIYWDGIKWKDEGMILEIKESVRSLSEDEEGNVWLGHTTGTIKLSFKNAGKGVRKNNDTQSYSYQKFDNSAGLPKGVVHAQNVNGNMLFGTTKGIFKFSDGKFVPDKSMGSRFTDGGFEIHRISYEENTGKIWVEAYMTETNKFEFGFLKKEADGKYSWNITSFLPYSDDVIHSIFHDTNGITWFGGAAGLFRYNSNITTNEDRPYNTIIRRVTIGKDSTIFNGTFYDSDKISSLEQNATLKSVLPFENNSVIFEFSALDYVNEGAELYQYFLEGFDKGWSNWKNETKAVYTNLPEGSYFFRVKAKNIFNKESNEAVYEFTIQPPWYRTWWAYVLYFLSSIAFIWGVVTYSSRGLKRIIIERTAEIVKQKEEIEYKNRNITDSINYAKRIQEAILPHYEVMRSRFPESFILYKPKDIVAGDFYWFAEKDRKFMVAACDCTGHGVPGAFMSLIGYSLLNEVILEKALTTPSHALDAMKKGIIKSLGQTGQEGEQKDGMDMALVSLDVTLENSKVIHKLTYAGANNSLYLIRKGELIELNADKMPIGIYHGQDRPFTNKELILESGDTFYLFTDGYADQFGGEQGKKLTKKRFKDVLIHIQEQNMKSQKATLEKTLSNWAGEQQQVDDVLVIGMRIV